RGILHISDGRMPLAPAIGTLRKADIAVTIAKQDVKTTIDAKLGSGSITGELVAKLEGGLPKVAEIKKLALRQISPIGAVQPVIDADITGKSTRTGLKWPGNLAVRKGKIYVPPDGGDELLATGTPSDLIFVNDKPLQKKQREPKEPWLIADIDIGSTAL